MIYLVYENADKTEGRGPMVRVKDSGYFTDENEAWDFADTIPGVMGVKPASGSWRNEKYPSVQVIAVEKHDLVLAKKKREIKDRIHILQQELKELENGVH